MPPKDLGGTVDHSLTLGDPERIRTHDSRIESPEQYGPSIEFTTLQATNLLYLERAMGIEPTTLCLGIGAASFSLRLSRSQIRNRCR